MAYDTTKTSGHDCLLIEITAGKGNEGNQDFAPMAAQQIFYFGSPTSGAVQFRHWGVGSRSRKIMAPHITQAAYSLWGLHTK